MGSLICRIELNKETEKGILISVENKEEDITHLIQLNGDSIKIESKNNKKNNNTRFIQDPNLLKLEQGENNYIFLQDGDIKLKCKNFSLESSENVAITSTNTNITASKNLTAKATMQANVTGKITTIKGEVTKVEGGLVKLG